MSFQDYYKHYLTLHQNPWNRLLHVLGQVATIAYIVWVISTGYWILLLAAPFVVYPFAWSGHMFFEKNTPAAWSKPLWAKACDWVMLKDILLRRI
jgi:hypothetical protein